MNNLIFMPSDDRGFHSRFDAGSFLNLLLHQSFHVGSACEVFDLRLFLYLDSILGGSNIDCDSHWRVHKK